MTSILPFILLVAACEPDNTNCSDTGGSAVGDGGASDGGAGDGGAGDGGSGDGGADGGAGDGGGDGGGYGGSGDGGADTLDEDELAALDTWTASKVEFLVGPDRVAYQGDRVRVIMTDLTGRLDIATNTTRATDYNSSRSNRSTSTIIELDEPGGDGDPALLTWDGRVCSSTPCPGDYREAGQISQLTIDFSGHDYLATSWGETTPRSEWFGGYVALGAQVDFRGHVTVLKAAAGGGDGVQVTCAPEAVNYFIMDGDEVVYEGRWSTDLVIDVEDGTGLPRGVEVVEGATGTELSMVW